MLTPWRTGIVHAHDGEIKLGPAPRRTIFPGDRLRTCGPAVNASRHKMSPPRMKRNIERRVGLARGRDHGIRDILHALLLRANPLDFPPAAGGFAQVCWLLSKVQPTDLALTETFIASVCTHSWLKRSYEYSVAGHLASGLRRLALSQPVQRSRHFHHPGLIARLGREIDRFPSLPAGADEPSLILQLIGCSALCGCPTPSAHINAIRASAVVDIITKTTLYESVDGEIHWQQLWLGVRTFVSVVRRNMLVPRQVAKDALQRWKLSFATDVTGDVVRRLQASMVDWLETCVAQRSHVLIPSSQPLWAIPGFPTARTRR